MMKVKDRSDMSQPNTDRGPLEMKQLFYNNLQLLGFDAGAMEAANHIPFNKSMFELPNKRGAEIVLHFLFKRLNDTMCREAFRDCWPILDKKREQGFRKACYNWLTNIAQDEPESRLPRINASLFMSPGGDKFYQLMFHFSGYVLQKSLDIEIGSKLCDRVKYPSLSSQNVALGEVMLKNITCSSIRHRQNYFDTAQMTLQANKTWKDTVDEYVRDYRRLNKEVRDLDYNVRTEEQKHVEASLARGSPVKKRGQSEVYDGDGRTIKRAQRIQQVRDMWKQLDDFERTESAEREVVESIVERTVNKYKLHAADISIQVPDMLLRECGEEIRRRNVDNTYQGGKLNLVSVLQLWNLCLHLYIEKIQQIGVPKFDQEVKKMTSQVHVQQSYTQNAQSLRQQMAERIPEMKASIEQLREKLDGVFFKDQSPDSIRTTSIGLGLVGPSPQPNFSPGAAVTPAGGLGIQLSPQHVDTPEAAERITTQVESTVRQGPRQLFGDHVDVQLLKRKEDSSIPLRSKSESSQVNSRHSSRPSSARSTTSTKGSRSSVKSTPRSGAKRPPKSAVEEPKFITPPSPRTMVERLHLDNTSMSSGDHGNMDTSQPLSARSDRSTRSDRSSRTLSARSVKSSASPRSVKSASSGSSTARSHDQSGDKPANQMVSDRSQGRKTPTDYLVEEIMGEGKILSPFNSGMEAFVSREVINRTPDLDTGDTGLEDLGASGDNKENILPAPHCISINISQGSSTPTDRSLLAMTLPQCGVTPTNALVIEVGVEKGALQIDPPYDLLTDNGEDDIGFDDILGPELDEEYDNVRSQGSRSQGSNSDGERSYEGSQGSVRSEEHVIVIDKSQHAGSPRLYTDRVSPELYAPESVDMLIDEEQFPSLDNSPRQAIVIDRSFTNPAVVRDSRYLGNINQSSLMHRENQSMSPGGSMSQSFQGRQSEDTPSSAKAMLSRSLVQERSPLSQEIRRMFKEAVATTPPHAANTPPRLPTYGSQLSDELELPNMDPNSRQMDLDSIETGNKGLGGSGKLQRADISWDMTENLDDIQMPDIDFGRDSDNDEILNNSDTAEGVVGNVNTDFGKQSAEGEGVATDFTTNADIEDFFSSKTPELPKRTCLATTELRTPPQGGASRLGGESFGEGSSLDMPKFPLSSLEDEALLISFTP